MERHVPEPTHTLEGWHVLHDFRLLDFARWFSAPLEAREDAWEELKGLVREWRELEEAGQGSYGIYQVVGHKADLLFLNGTSWDASAPQTSPALYRAINIVRWYRIFLSFSYRIKQSRIT